MTQQGVSESQRTRLLEAFHALEKSDHHVVCLSEESTSPRTKTNSESSATHVAKDVTAVVLVGLLNRRSVIEQFLITLVRVFKGPQPIIVLCVDESESVSLEEMEAALASFTTLGAHELVMQKEEGSYFELEASVHRAIQSGRERRFRTDLDVEREQRRLLWPQAHIIMPGFPKLQTSPNIFEKTSSLMHKIGDGTFCKVFKCKSKSNDEVEALKVVQKVVLSQTSVRALWNEIVFLQKLNHPNVVGLKSAIHTPDHVFLIMDFAGEQTLLAYMTASDFKADAVQAWEVHRQIIAGISYCHREGVAHRDLSHDNIVIQCDAFSNDPIATACIIDFGCAVPSADACTDTCGSVPFIPPEVILKSAGERYDPKCVDAWACGVLLLEMFCGVDRVMERLGWAEMPQANVAYGERLISFFESGSTVTTCIRDSGIVSLSEPVELALLGMLTPSPASRWSLEQVEQLA